MLHMRPIERLMKSLPAGADAALVISGHNRRYLTGFPSSAGLVLATRDQLDLLEGDDIVPLPLPPPKPELLTAVEARRRGGRRTAAPAPPQR